MLTTLERLVLLRDFDDPRSVLHDRNFAGRAEVCLARFIRLPTRDATLATQPTTTFKSGSTLANQEDSEHAQFVGLATILARSSVRVFVHGQLTSRSETGTNGLRIVVDLIVIERSRHRVTPLGHTSIPSGVIGVGIDIGIGIGSSVSVLIAVGLGSICAGPRAVGMGGLSVVILRLHFAMLKEEKRRYQYKLPSFSWWETVPRSL